MSQLDPASAQFFEAKYRHNADPWNFAGSEYEQRRYRAIVAALEVRRYKRAFEPGCSIGVLTTALAALCDHVDALDFSTTAAEQARTRCAHLPNVVVACDSLPRRLPAPGTDLLVLSEIGYYFHAPDFARLVDLLLEPLAPGATVLAAHWLGSSPDHFLSGDEVHGILRAHPGLRLDHSEHHESFRLDRWTRP